MDKTLRHKIKQEAIFYYEVRNKKDIGHPLPTALYDKPHFAVVVIPLEDK